MKTTPKFDLYIAQMGQEALKELSEDKPLKERLIWARYRISAVATEHHLNGTPHKLQEAIMAVNSLTGEESFPDQSRAIREAIEEIFEAYGRHYPE